MRFLVRMNRAVAPEDRRWPPAIDKVHKALSEMIPAARDVVDMKKGRASVGSNVEKERSDRVTTAARRLDNAAEVFRKGVMDAYASGEFERVVDDDFGGGLARARNDLSRLEARIAAIGESIADLGGKLAVAKTAESFRREARSGIWWMVLWGTATALLIGGLVWYAETVPPTAPADATLWAVLATRVVVLSAFSVSIAVSIGMLRGAAHNHVLNRHRYNALSTFQLFYDDEHPDEVRQAAITHAMQAAFAARATGMTGRESPGVGSETLVKTVAAQLKAK